MPSTMNYEDEKNKKNHEIVRTFVAYKSLHLLEHWLAGLVVLLCVSESCR